jgi:hypothetical protein
MPPTAHDPADDRVVDETYFRIAIDPPLPCGINGCERLTSWGQVERDPRFTSLWNLLPLCKAHQVSLAAGALDVLSRKRPHDE